MKEDVNLSHLVRMNWFFMTSLEIIFRAITLQLAQSHKICAQMVILAF
jgi:hypothetical protein